MAIEKKGVIARSLCIGFVIAIILNTQFAFALSYSNSLPPSDAVRQQPQAQGQGAVWVYENSPLEMLSQAYLADAIVPAQDALAFDSAAPNATNIQETTASFSCSTKSLTPQEIQLLKSEVNDKGVKMQKIDSGTPADKERPSLQQGKIILTDDKETVAIKEQLPSKEVAPVDFSAFLNQHVKGAFKFGLKLDDTLRIARCNNISPKSCAVDGGNLKWRNSGEGISSDFGNVWKDLGGIFDGNKFVEGMTAEELETLKVRAEQQDKNSFEYVDAKRIPGNPVKNYIKADFFSAKMMTNCVDNKCAINTYSLFDKMFNSYFSANMVMSTFGPTLYGSTKKLFGWFSRRGVDLSVVVPKPLKSVFTNLKEKFQTASYSSKIGKASLLSSPADLYGTARIARAMTNINKYDFKEAFHAPLFPRDLKILGSGSYNGWLQSKDTQAFLESLAKDPVRKKAFYDVVTDFKGYFDTVKTVKTAEFSKAFGKGAPVEKYLRSQGLSSSSPNEDILRALSSGTPEARAASTALREYGQNTTKIIKDVDEYTSMDLGEYIQTNQEFGLSKMAVRNSETGEFVHMPSNVRLFRENLENVYAETGTFAKAGGASAGQNVAKLETDAAGSLKLFKVNPAGTYIRDISPADLEIAVTQGKYATTFAKLDTGELVPLNASSLSTIKAGTTGNVKLYDAGWVDAGVLTPEDFSLRLVDRMDYYLGKPSSNLSQLKGTLIERGYVARRYASVLDKAMADEQSLIKSYFSVKGGLKWTLYPFVYWEAKRGGYDIASLAGIQDFTQFSAYELPDSWSNIAYSTKGQPIYNDAMIDFFANEGSDQGDLFVQVLNLGIWKQAVEKVAGIWPAAQQGIDKFTGENARSKVEDIAVYVSGPQKCDNCDVVLSSDKEFSVFN
ncbi:MAG: hypothetical protein WC602_06540, partial [archaeon]